jgi:hypothetical protein
MEYCPPMDARSRAERKWFGTTRTNRLHAIAIEREWHDLRALEREAAMPETEPEGGFYDRKTYRDRQIEDRRNRYTLD